MTGGESMNTKPFTIGTILLTIMILLVGCSKSTPEIPAEGETIQSYIEKDIPLDSNIKKVLDLYVNESGNVEIVSCEQGIFHHWILEEGTYIETKDERFKDMVAKNSMALTVRKSSGELYVLLQNEKDEYLLYEMKQGELPKVIPLDFYQTDEGYEWIKDFAITESGDIVLGYEGFIVYYDGATYEEKSQIELEYSKLVACGNELFYTDKDKNLRVVSTDSKTEMIPLPIDGTKVFTVSESKDKQSVLIGTDKGFYQYRLGGSVLEQLMSASGKSLQLTSPQAYIVAQNQVGEYYVAFGDDGGQTAYLRQYYYGEEETLQEQEVIELTFYTLFDSYILRDLVTNFNYEHPSIHVTHVKGMTAEESFPLNLYAEYTLETNDAIRNLNSDLLAGKGPDIMVLDLLPIESMIEKNMLMDLSDVINDQIQADSIYPTIAKTYEKDGAICALPTYFSLMVMVGDEELTTEATDLTSFADEMERLEKISNKPAHFDQDWQTLFRTFYLTSAPSWIIEKGNFDYGALKNFLKDTKRIVKVCEDKGVLDISSYMYGNWIDGTSEAGIGMMSGPTTMRILELGQEKHGGQVGYLSGQAKNVYVPSTILGISASSKNQEAAKVFLEYALTEKPQSCFYGGGAIPFPINKKVNENAKAFPNAFEWNGGKIDVELPSGEVFIYDWPKEETFVKVNAMLEQAKTPANIDYVMRDLIMEEARLYYEDKESLEKAMEKVERKLHIYLAE